MKKYDSYKDSSVEWIGEIPNQWNRVQLRRIGELYGGLTGKSGDDFNSDINQNNKPYIPFTNIFNNTYISKDHFDNVVIDDNENQNRVQKFDLFFLMSSEDYDDLGKSSILIEDVEELYLNSFCKGFRINRKDVYPLFLNYQLLGDVHKKLISVEGNGFTRINLRQDRLKETPILIPPLSEQKQIVSFLDAKTEIIDTLIEKSQKKIELLKEKRTALINEAVTKGLDPNVEMKDSGVEWIGEIPSHWEIKPLFTVSEHSKEKNSDNETTVLSLSYGRIKIRDVETNFGLLPDSFDNYQRVRPGYIILRLTDLQNDKKSLRVGHSYIDGIITPAYVGLICNSKILSEFLYYHLHNSDMKKVLYSLGGGLRQTLRYDELKRFPVLHIPIDEQKQIVDYIHEKTQLIDKTLSTEVNRIELLKEYRQSLISEVVTGKVKVTEDE